MNNFTHFDEHGRAVMVGVGEKAETRRVAVCAGRITMQPSTLTMIRDGAAKKGDVLGVARLAGIMAPKRTADLIPLCHPIALTKVTVDFTFDTPGNAIECSAMAETVGRTGVEMEALTAASIALLTIYDMCKAVDRGMTIQSVRLVEKLGGKSGHWKA